MAFNDHVRPEYTARADRDVGANRAEWTNFTSVADLGVGVDDSVIVDLDHSDNSPEFR